MAQFLYPPAVMLASLRQERIGYQARLDAATEKAERERLTRRLASVDDAIAIHQQRQQAELDALAEAAAQAAAEAQAAATGGA